MWNFDAKRPEDTYFFEKWDREKTEMPWHYGVTGDGSRGEGLYQGMQGARIRYMPAPEMGAEGKRNMEVLLEADPAKSAGQGFGSAGQYLDVCLKMDTETLDGYGLRILRTAAHSDAVSNVSDKICSRTGAGYFRRYRNQLFCNRMQDPGAV